MKTLTLTAKDFKNGNYIGKTDLHDYHGNIEIGGRLGCISVESIKCSGYLHIGFGTSIEAGWSIESGECINAGGYIEAGTSIKTQLGLSSGLHITCNGTLTFSLRCFAGICQWRSITDDEKTITCRTLIGGEVCYGIVNEAGETPSNTIEIEGKHFTIDELTSLINDAK